MSAAQNIEEEEMFDKLLLDYMMKKSNNNMSHIVETSGQVIVLTATTTRQILIEAGQISASYDPRESTFRKRKARSDSFFNWQISEKAQRGIHLSSECYKLQVSSNISQMYSFNKKK